MKNFTKILFVLLLGGILLVTSCKKEINEVTFTNIPTTMYVDDSFTVEYSKQDKVTATFESSNTQVATVSGEKVTAVSAGEFTLTVTFTLGKKTKEYTHKITVVNAEYNITYNLSNGTLSSDAPSKYNVKALPLTLVNPTREGYNFLGWYTTEDYSGSAITSVQAGTTGDLNLYAKWGTDTYSITYNLDGGVNNESNPTTFTVEDEVVLAEPTKEGYNFLGWYEEAEYTTLAGTIEKGTLRNVEVYAKWELVNYSITYYLDGGVNNESNPTTFTVEDEVVLAEPTKEGYNFLGWYKDAEYTTLAGTIEKGTLQNVEVYAKWEKIKVTKTIKYNLDGGVNPEDAPTSYVVGEGCDLPTPTKEGYNFLGWTLSKTSTNYIMKVPTTQKFNLTLYAKWEKIKVYSEIEYVLDGGQLITTGDVSKYEEGVEFTLPIPTQEGFKFLGWSLEEGSTEYVEVIPATSTGKVTVYANWEEYQEPVVGEPFTINYELNGGSWSWTVAEVTDAAKGIDSVSNLPEIFMADFYAYLVEYNLLNSSKVASSLHVTNWAGFSTPYPDPIALYNNTSKGGSGYSAADGYSELFFDSVNGYEAIGGFLGTSPYKEKYANLTKHLIQLTTLKYPSETPSSSYFKGAAGYVLDGYFYGTQGLLSSSKANYETFNSLRASIPTPTVGYEGTVSSENSYVVTEGIGGTELQLVAPVKEGHMFLGWYDNPSFTGEKITSVKFGCTLYAYWYDLNADAPTFKINYVLNGGENDVDAPLEYVQFEGVELLKPTKQGYTFVGWSTDEEGLDTITHIPATAHGDFTVYANWVEGEEEIYKISYTYTEGKLPTRTPSTIDEVREYVFTSYYNWLKPSEDYETFKTNVINQWKGQQSQGSYKFYKQGGKDTIDADYFCNAPENFEEWNAWFTVFDAQVTAANGAQNAWNSYVGILRLGQWLSNTSPTTWKDSMNQAIIDGTFIKIPLVTEYKVGTEVELVNLTIDDGRTFLGWYDEAGNKVEKIAAGTKGNIKLTAKWSEAIPVESFTVTNQVEKLLKLSSYQLTWVIGPDNATFKKVTFKSSDESVLSVSEDGLLTAVSIGTAKVLITVHGNTTLNMEFEVEVYVDPYIDGEFVEESYIVKEESTQLAAQVSGIDNAKLVWKSNTPSIASVDETGAVTGISEGVAEIVVSVEGNENVTFTFYVTVLDAAPTGMLKLLLDSHNKEIFRRDDLGIGAGTPAYYWDIYGSVSNLLFEDYVVHMDYYVENPTKTTTLSAGGIQFITFHYAADMPSGGNAYLTGGKNLAAYQVNASGVSWHYSTGMDGIWAGASTNWGAWHAGSSKALSWYPTGVTVAQVGTDVYTPHVTLGSDGYFYIKGVKTTVQNTAGNYKLNAMGLAVKLEGNEWYIGGHYYNSTYQLISSQGGNNNSVGIESSVREGSDLWLTWQYSAQLCANLLLEFNLPIQRLVGHHFFSGKDCPQPLLENDLEIWWEFVEMTEREMELFKNYKDYKLSFASDSSYLQANGRVKDLPNYPECVTYTVTYTTGSTTKTITLPSILSGKLQ